MLAIRLQRLGRKQYPVYRVAIQEAQRHPSSGRVVAYAGSYNPHTKQVSIDKEKVEKYLSNGAQPSPRVVRLLEEQKIKLPHWVKRASGKQERTTRHPEKLRKNQPAEDATADAPANEETTASDSSQDIVKEAGQAADEVAEVSPEDTSEEEK